MSSQSIRFQLRLFFNFSFSQTAANPLFGSFGAGSANPLFGSPFGAGLGMLPASATNSNDRFSMGHQQQQQQQVNIRCLDTHLFINFHQHFDYSNNTYFTLWLGPAAATEHNERSCLTSGKLGWFTSSKWVWVYILVLRDGYCSENARLTVIGTAFSTAASTEFLFFLLL